MSKYFYRVSNSCTDYREIMIRFCMDRYKTIEGRCSISLQQICQMCNYTVDKHKGRFFDYCKNLLLRFLEQNLITQVYGKPPGKAGANEVMCFVLGDSFSPNENYTTLSADSFDKIIRIETSIKREVLIHTYLYIKSFIYDYQPNDKNNKYVPYGFYGNLSSACDELGYARKTVDICLDLFVEHGIFKRHITGSYKKLNGSIGNVPNIYVLNDENAERNIRLLKEKLEDQYNVIEFLPQTFKNKALKRK